MYGKTLNNVEALFSKTMCGKEWSFWDCSAEPVRAWSRGSPILPSSGQIGWHMAKPLAIPRRGHRTTKGPHRTFEHLPPLLR